jgi:hypothetical protein
MTTETTTFPTGTGLFSALKCLRQAYDCAQELRQSEWEFAVEIESLRSEGCTQTDCRWLIRKGYVEHAVEITGPAEKERRFRAVRSLTLPKRTCFVLTPAGADFCDRTISAMPAGEYPSSTLFRTPAEEATAMAPRLPVPSYTNGHAGGARGIAAPRRTTIVAPRYDRCRVPVWDPELHELRVGRQVVKRFIRPAPSQELILNVFAEEGWPAAIDDPLPALHGIDLKRRLHHTIRNLNRAQHPHVIQFSINGQGKRIRWRLTPAALARRQSRVARVTQERP